MGKKGTPHRKWSKEEGSVKEFSQNGLQTLM